MGWYVTTGAEPKGPYATDVVGSMYDAGEVTGADTVAADRSGPWLSFADRSRFEAHAAEVEPASRAVDTSHHPEGSLLAMGFASIGGFLIMALVALGVPWLAAGASAVALVLVSFLTGWSGHAPGLVRGWTSSLARMEKPVDTRMADVFSVVMCLGFLTWCVLEGGDPMRSSYKPQARYVPDCVEVNSLACLGQRFVLTGKVTGQDGDDVRVMATDHGWDLKMRSHPSRNYVGRTVTFNGMLADYHLVHDDMTDAAILDVKDDDASR